MVVREKEADDCDVTLTLILDPKIKNKSKRKLK